MTQLNASALHRAIDKCKLRVLAASTEFGRFPTVFVMIGCQRIARIGSQFHDHPKAVAQGLTVHIDGSPGVRVAIDIKCANFDEASLIAFDLDNRFRGVFSEMYCDRNCLSEKACVSREIKPKC